VHVHFLDLDLENFFVLIKHACEWIMRKARHIESLIEKFDDFPTREWQVDRLGVLLFLGFCWQGKCWLLSDSRYVKVLVHEVRVLVLHSLDQPFELKAGEKEWLVLVKQVIDIDSVSVHQITLYKNLFVADVDETIGQEHSREAEKFNFLMEHEPIHEDVIADLKGEVEADCWHESQRVGNVVEAHHLLEDVQLAEKGKVIVAVAPHDIDEFVEGWIEEDLELSFDLFFVD